MESENCLFSLLIYSLTIIVIIIVLIDILYKYIYSLSNINLNNDQYVKSIRENSRKIFLENWINIDRMLKTVSYSVVFPSEIISIFRMKFGGYMKKVGKMPLSELANTLNDMDFCYATLNKVSRSFSFVIEELPDCLKDSICIFYLVLRALDSIEDDNNYPNEKKIILLRNFHQKLLIDNWSINHIGDKEDYQILLSHFNKVINVFKSLDLQYQRIIIDITKRMGNGMADFVGENQSIDTIENYNLYCHYVAGLVGHGLSSLFAQCGLENKDLHLHQQLSNSMGLVLQKTNIIRDYLEDLQAGRTWWPKQIWTNYTSDIADFVNTPNDERSLQCLNHMLIDSLSHLPDVINYLNRLNNPKIFQFCAIPQVMAIATVAELYNNPLVFTSIVKIRKGLTCKLIFNCSNLNEVLYWVHFFLDKIQKKIAIPTDENTNHMHQIVNQLKKLCQQYLQT